MSKYILVIDQGTTSSRVIIYDRRGNSIFKAQKELAQIYPKPGYVEFDADIIYEDVVKLMHQALKEVNIDLKDIVGCGVTNQRETTVLWDKTTGKPIYNAICWQSVQSDSICTDLKNKGYEKVINEKTGLIINPYFSASKIKWILDNVSGAKELMDQGNLSFGTIDSWLIYRLTGKHVTDYTNASRTLLFNIHTLSWDKELLDIFGVSESILPALVSSNETIGMITEERIKKYGDFEICAIAGDQQASLIGHTCLYEGDLKITYGTGSFMLLNTGRTPHKSNNGLLTTVAYKIGDTVAYALEGSVFCAGAAFKYIRDNLEIVKSFDDENFMPTDSNGVIFVPSLTGLGAPYWSSEAKGAILGMTRGTSKHDIAFATILGVAYLNYDVLLSMKDDTKIDVDLISVDGGASTNSILMQAESDITKTNISAISTSEATSLGICYLVSLNKGIVKSFEEIKERYKRTKLYKPKDTNYSVSYDKWKKACRLVMEYDEE